MRRFMRRDAGKLPEPPRQAGSDDEAEATRPKRYRMSGDDNVEVSGQAHEMNRGTDSEQNAHRSQSHLR